jgi:hypothetical protein
MQTAREGSMSDFEDDSRTLVPAQGDAQGFDKKHQEKWLIYCPALERGTLLYLVTALESYSLRSYGGRFGVNAKGMHAEGAHTASEFMRMYTPAKWKSTDHIPKPVTDIAYWEGKIAEQWSAFQRAEEG